VHYHPGKANVIADALSQKNHCNCLTMKPMDLSLCHEMEKLNIEIVQQGSLANITIESTIRDQIIIAQKESKGIGHIKKGVRMGKASCFKIDDARVLWFKNHLVAPKVSGLHQKILDEAHLTIFSIDPRSNKMYHDLKQRFWWTKMKIEIARYVTKCDTCQNVKVVHLNLAREL
jgi:hypothetical protein